MAQLFGKYLKTKILCLIFFEKSQIFEVLCKPTFRRIEVGGGGGGQGGLLRGIFNLFQKSYLLDTLLVFHYNCFLWINGFTALGNSCIHFTDYSQLVGRNSFQFSSAFIETQTNFVRTAARREGESKSGCGSEQFGRIWIRILEKPQILTRNFISVGSKYVSYTQIINTFFKYSGLQIRLVWLYLYHDFEKKDLDPDP